MSSKSCDSNRIAVENGSPVTHLVTQLPHSREVGQPDVSNLAVTICSSEFRNLLPIWTFSFGAGSSHDGGASQFNQIAGIVCNFVEYLNWHFERPI
jgi:hypothetical protein